MSIPNTDFINVEEAAKIIGCTPGRVHQLLRSGDIPGQKLSERAWVILRKDAEKIAANPSNVGRPRKFSPPQKPFSRLKKHGR